MAGRGQPRATRRRGEGKRGSIIPQHHHHTPSQNPASGFTMPHLNTERDANALLLLTLVAFEPGEGDDGLAGRSVVLLVVSDSVQKCDCGGGYSAPYDNDHDHHLCRQSGYHDDDWNEQDHGDEDIDDALKLLVSETSEALKRGRAREVLPCSISSCATATQCPVLV